MNFSIKDARKLINSKEFKEGYKLFEKNAVLGFKIYARRKELGLSQEELGKKAKIPQHKISMLESATYGEPGNDILERLANALQVPYTYLSNYNISRRTFEIYNYILPKLKKYADIMQFMKIPYFIDLAFIDNNEKQVSNFEYIRWNYGPFDKKVYAYQEIFFGHEKGYDDVKYMYLSENDRKLIDEVLAKLPIDDGNKLKELSYETRPMKKLGVKMGDNKEMGTKLDLYA